MSKPLFKDFEPISAKAWKQKIQADLKGADYNNTLIWKNNEGINVKPFYHSDDFETLPEISSTKATQWQIAQNIEVKDEKEANTKALDAINRGAECIIFNVENDTISIETLLQNIELKLTNVELKFNFLSNAFIKKVNDVAEAHNGKIATHTDIIANLAKTGNWYTNLKTDHQHFENLIQQTNQLSIDASLYQNVGATIVQQLAYALAHANEYLNHLEAILSSEIKQSLQIIFNVAVSSNYFFEIAKIRALRQLWATLASEYGVNTNCKIIATPTKRNKTIYDYNTNMLRSTTECMSAILGGANVVCNLPYDALYQKPNEFGDRIARNQLLILKHESYFNTVNNPADGAYYIESLTQQLSEKALNLFKDIELNGGFLKQLKEGTIQRKIKESAAKEQADFDAENLVLIGTNKYQNTNDKMVNNLEKSPFLKFEKRKTIIEPILEKRLAEQLEINRLNKE